jgi:hypothetical protein
MYEIFYPILHFTAQDDAISVKDLGFSPGLTMKKVSSGMSRRVVQVSNDVSEELSASFIRVTRLGELGITLAVTNN